MTMVSGNVCCFVVATFSLSLLLKRFFSSTNQSESRDRRQFLCYGAEPTQ